MQVEKNKVVTFHYTLRLDSGEKVESTTSQKPVNIIVGYNHIIPGLEKALLGLEIGEQKNGIIVTHDAYGPINKKNVKAYSRKTIPGNINLKIGKTLNIKKKNGQQVKMVVKFFDKNKIVLDSNHPLAGVNLNFKTKIVNIREATQEELESGILT